MRKVVILAFVALGALGVGAVATAHDDDGSSHNGARLNGYQEVSSVSTTGFGSFHIKFNKDMTADYVLSYKGIETPVQQAHIHFGHSARSTGRSRCGSATATPPRLPRRRSSGTAARRPLRLCPCVPRAAELSGHDHRRRHPGRSAGRAIVEGR